ncbi:hypothetical protein SDC9_116476 [bioreactor metagenome]|uniref:Uncharacterized protein n=1 Tax=bioreactor metagenome TaxID=1076179 RepID=A0A645BXZ4_9ZZZZ
MLKKSLMALLFCALLLSACERPATRSDWSPIEDSSTAPVATATLPATLEAPVFTPEPTETPAAIQSTLDFSSLPTQLPPSMKGYELYSWQVDEEWNFTLVTGTNRTKTFDEIIAPENSVDPEGYVKLTVSGVENLKKLLALLPAGEQILWGGMDLGGQVPAGTVYLSFPSTEMLAEMKTYCAGLGLTLTSLNEQ